MNSLNSPKVMIDKSNIPENCLLKLEMQDGSVQFIQMQSKEPVIEVRSGEPSESINAIANAKNFMVVYPNELNLSPITKAANNVANNSKKDIISAPRGRPRKTETPVETTPKKDFPLKMMRTRSGRITRPPVHMEKEFEKIVISKKDACEDEDLTTVRFEPMKTENNSNLRNESPKFESLALKSSRKRPVPGQYRCLGCKKAYLGRNRMALHLKKHPDHGIVNHMNMEDSESWSCLIETALKAKDGQKGIKFCKELIHLVKSARTLAKYFLKPAKEKKVEYVVDPMLASILNIKEGGYRFNENELCKDISIFSFLDYFDCSFSDNLAHNAGSCETVDENEESNAQEAEKPSSSELKEIKQENPPKNENGEVEQHQAKIDLHFGSDIMDVIEANSPQQSNDLKSVQTVDIYRQHEFIKEGKSVESSRKTCKKLKRTKISKKSDLSNYDSDYIDTSEMLQCSSRQIYSGEPPIKLPELSIISSNDNDQLINGLSDKTSKEVKKSSSRKLQDDFYLHKLHLDEFMLPDAPTNMLDTSTGSDDIMNVDQFVNERFKKLTESDELPNNSLNLELPSLECFNFNTQM